MLNVIQQTADPSPDDDTLKFLATHISKVAHQKESNQFAAVWLLGEEEFKYQPHSKDSEDDPLMDEVNPFSPNPTQAGQTYIVARPYKKDRKDKKEHTMHSEEFIMKEVNTV